MKASIEDTEILETIKKHLKEFITYEQRNDYQGFTT